MGVNAAGLGSKLLSFRNVLEILGPCVVFVEETKFVGEKNNWIWRLWSLS